MADKSKFVIQTRQKAELLFEVVSPLGAAPSATLGVSKTFASPPRLVQGYGAINFLIISDVAFTLRIQEASTPAGPWAQTVSQASALDAATGNQFICLQVAPCGAYMRVFVDNGPAAQGSFTLEGVGLPVAGGGSSGGGGGGTSSVVQLRDGSVSATLASVKVDGTLIDGQGSVLAGGRDPNGEQRALAVTTTGELIVQGSTNRPTFAQGQLRPAAAGAAEELPAQPVPNGFAVFVRAFVDNDDFVYIGNSEANAENPAVGSPLEPGGFAFFYLTDINPIWVNSLTTGDGVYWYVEV